MAFDKRKALQNALAYTQQGRWDRAIVEYLSILKADPRDVTVCNNLGDLFARAGKTGEAIDQYLKLGELYRADGLSVKAIAVYKKIAKLDPARTEAYLACADLYWEQGLLGEAKIQMATVVEHFTRSGETEKLIDAYKRLSQFDPTNANILARLADVMLREGMRDGAAAEYERAAQAAQAAGQAAEAKRLLQKAREASPSGRESKATAAERLTAEGKVTEAIDLLKELTAAEPGNPRAWRALGEAEASQRHALEAVTALQRAVALGVPEADVARSLGLMLLQAGREEDAVALCRRTTESGIAGGYPDPAIACCRDLAAAAPGLIALHAHLAATLQNLGRLEDARAALRSLATAQEAAGQPESAVATYHRLVELDPADEEARLHLEALEPPFVPPVPEPDTDSPSEPPAVEWHAPAETVQTEVSDATDVSLQPLEDLGLSLGAEDAALLLEESDAAATVAAPDGAAAEADPAGAGGDGVPDEAALVTDWLTQELQSIDLEAAAPEGDAVAAEWSTSAPTFELDDVATSVGGSGLAPLEDELALQLDGPPAHSDGESVMGDIPVVELPDGSADPPGSLVDLPPSSDQAVVADPPEDDPQSSQVTEQLAEADVYQKYGLTDKARERLLEVIHIAPDHVTARRRLKAIYRERLQTEEASAESLAIARILRARDQEDAAAAEIRDALSVAPDQPDLLRFLLGSTAEPEPASVAAPAAFSPGPGPAREDREPSPVEKIAPAAPLDAADQGQDDAPPPDVPLLLDLDEGPLADIASSAGSFPGTPDAEVVPAELQALLDGNDAEAVMEPAPAALEGDRAVADDVAEAEFYLSQGMADEARVVHRRLHDRDPQHPAVGALAAAIERVTSGPPAPEPVVPAPAPPPEAPAAEQASGPLPASPVMQATPSDEASPQFTVTSEPTGGLQGEFVDLGAELDQELDKGEDAHATPASGPVVDGLLRELQKGVREHLDEKDYETHYNLGIAYKEMELYDEAIQEFRLTAREPKRALECADLVGLCYLAKGQPEQAIQDLQSGLAVQGHPPDAYHAVRYDLGAAYEAAGDLPRALEQFEILHAEGARFLDVQTRIEALRARLPGPPAPAPPDAKPRRKKKISFI